MTLFILDKFYSKNFIKNGLPKYISSEFLRLATDSKYKGIREVLNTQYKTSVNQIADKLKTAIQYSETQANYFIYINDQVMCNQYKLSELLRFLNFGSRDVRGSNMLRDFLRNSEQNLQRIYKFFILTGGTSIWE